VVDLKDAGELCSYTSLWDEHYEDNTRLFMVEVEWLTGGLA
jgi:hypothetical protein